MQPPPMRYRTSAFILHISSKLVRSIVLDTLSAVSLLRLTADRKNHITFTYYVVQNGKTVLMIAAGNRASVETMQLLLDSGAATSINAKDNVTHLRFNLEL
jgi:hypothetical protein